MPRFGRTWRPRTSWSTRCGDGTRPGPESESTCATFPSRNGPRRKRSRSTMTPGRATRVRIAPASWSVPNERDLVPAALDLQVLLHALVDQLPLPALLDL